LQVSLQSLCLRVRRSLGESQDAFARTMSVSKATIQNWESGRGRPAPMRLKKMAEIAPGLAPELRAEMQKFEWHPRAPRREPVNSFGYISIKVRGRRFGEDTVIAAHEALDLILDHAPSEIIKKIQALLEKHAAQWRKDQ